MVVAFAFFAKVLSEGVPAGIRMGSASFSAPDLLCVICEINNIASSKAKLPVSRFVRAWDVSRASGRYLVNTMQC